MWYVLGAKSYQLAKRIHHTSLQKHPNFCFCFARTLRVFPQGDLRQHVWHVNPSYLGPGKTKGTSFLVSLVGWRKALKGWKLREMSTLLVHAWSQKICNSKNRSKNRSKWHHVDCISDTIPSLYAANFGGGFSRTFDQNFLSRVASFFPTDLSCSGCPTSQPHDYTKGTSSFHKPTIWSHMFYESNVHRASEIHHHDHPSLHDKWNKSHHIWSKMWHFPGSLATEAFDVGSWWSSAALPTVYGKARPAPKSKLP